MGTIVKIVLETCAMNWWSLDTARLSEQAKKACYALLHRLNLLISFILCLQHRLL